MKQNKILSALGMASTAQHSTAQHSTLRQLTKRIVQVTAFTVSCLVVLPSFLQTADAQTGDDYTCAEDDCELIHQAEERSRLETNYENSSSVFYSTDYLIYKAKVDKIFIKKEENKNNGGMS